MRYDSGSPANSSDDASIHEVGGTLELTESDQLGFFSFLFFVCFISFSAWYNNTSFQPSRRRNGLHLSTRSFRTSPLFIRTTAAGTTFSSVLPFGAEVGVQVLQYFRQNSCNSR
jgi:hypothetical protein